MALHGYYDITPFTVNVTPLKSYDCTQITVSATYSIGQSQMWVPFILATADGIPAYSDQVLIDESELAQWGTDDMYIVDLVCSKVGVTRV